MVVLAKHTVLGVSLDSCCMKQGKSLLNWENNRESNGYWQNYFFEAISFMCLVEDYYFFPFLLISLNVSS